MELTSSWCDKHQRNLMRHNGKEVCPTCECERFTAESEEEVRQEIQKAQVLKNYNVFKKHSILQDETLLDAAFSNYVVEEGEEKLNKERAEGAFEQYKQGEIFNTWLTGDTGVGKSHLAMAILRNLNERGAKQRKCLFVDVDEMLRKIRNSFGNKESIYTEQYFIDMLSEVDFLVLDDLGAETGDIDSEKHASEFTSRVLRAIINARQHKSTIITTNLSRQKLEQMYDKKMVSRMMKSIYLIHFKNTRDKRISNINF